MNGQLGSQHPWTGPEPAPVPKEVAHSSCRKVARVRGPPRVRWKAHSHWCKRLGERPGKERQGKGADLPPRPGGHQTQLGGAAGCGCLCGHGQPHLGRKLRLSSSSPRKTDVVHVGGMGRTPLRAVVRIPLLHRAGNPPGALPPRAVEAEEAPEAVFSLFPKINFGQVVLLPPSRLQSFQGSWPIRSISCAISDSFSWVMKASISITPGNRKAQQPSKSDCGCQDTSPLCWRSQIKPVNPKSLQPHPQRTSGTAAVAGTAR